MPNIQAAERERVERQHAERDRKLALLTRAHYPDPERRTLRVGHREYLVVWDGSVAAQREEVRPNGQPAPQRVCACGCGRPVSFRVRYASPSCAGLGRRGLPTVERVRHQVARP